MTTETLKPFIPQQSVDNYPAAHASATNRQRSIQVLAIGLSATVIVITLTLLGFTIWNLKRVSSLEAEVKSLDKVIVNLQKRLNIDYLEDLTDFEKEYNNALLDHPDTLHDDVDDDDDDDDIDDEEDVYDELLRKYSYDDEIDDIVDDDDDENMSTSDNDNVYSDFEKYKDLKKKQEKSRVTRAINAEQPNKQQQMLNGTNDPQMTATTTPSTTAHDHQIFKKKLLAMRLPSQRIALPENTKDAKAINSEKDEHKRLRRRHRDSRKSKNAIVKSGKTARQLSPMSYTPAAHFHLNRKVPDAYAPINVNSYNGDMYIGHPSWSNEIDIDSYFKVNNGMLTVLEPGLYYVYAQVCYNNTHDQNGFVIFHGHKPFLQCLNTVPTNMPHKIHTCHTSGLIYLKEDETIHLRDFHSDRNVILKDLNNRSYFGLIKI